MNESFINFSFRFYSGPARGPGGQARPSRPPPANDTPPRQPTPESSDGGVGGGGGGGPLHTPTRKDPAYYDGDTDLTQFDWFHGKLSSNDAYKVLSVEQKGAYLVRLLCLMLLLF